MNINWIMSKISVAGLSRKTSHTPLLSSQTKKRRGGEEPEWGKARETGHPSSEQLWTWGHSTFKTLERHVMDVQGAGGLQRETYWGEGKDRWSLDFTQSNGRTLQSNVAFVTWADLYLWKIPLAAERAQKRRVRTGWEWLQTGRSCQSCRGRGAGKPGRWRPIWVWILTLPHNDSVALGRLLHLPVPQLSHLWNVDNDYTYLYSEFISLTFVKNSKVHIITWNCIFTWVTRRFLCS